MRDVDDPRGVAGGSGVVRLVRLSGRATRATLAHGAQRRQDTLADQPIHPFTDLLLHDMGEGLADGRPDFDARVVRSGAPPPLWGLGLIDDVNGERFLLHDGRARTIEEAILWHGGEGEASRVRLFRTRRIAEERAALIAYLEAL